MSQLLSTLPRIITEDNICVIIENKPINVSASHINYVAIRSLFTDPEATVEDFVDLQDIPAAIVNSTDGKITINDNMEVMYNNTVMHNSLSRRMIDMLQEGFDISSMIVFMENLMNNPSKTSIDELYDFLEANNLPITPDGHFLAYKRVRDDYMDFHTGTMDNSVGKILEVPRNTVDDRREHTCSSGLHFCSLEYLSHFHSGEGRIVIVKINPKDVVSIPQDYNNSKGRTACYEVVAEHALSEEEEAFNSCYNDEYSPQKNNNQNCSCCDCSGCCDKNDDYGLDWNCDDCVGENCSECLDGDHFKKDPNQY
jgi:effector-binding domain-containing protein